jgi:hypothetical protein
VTGNLKSYMNIIYIFAVYKYESSLYPMGRAKLKLMTNLIVAKIVTIILQ